MDDPKRDVDPYDYLREFENVYQAGEWHLSSRPRMFIHGLSGTAKDRVLRKFEGRCVMW